MADYSINAVPRRVVYTGSAGVGPYAFTFEVLAQTDIAVYKNSTKLTLTTHYTVTINANGTGSVTLVTAATGSDRIIITGARAIRRTTDFATAGDLVAASLNEQLDANVIFAQQVAETAKRALTAPVYDPEHVDSGGTLDMTLPAAATRASKLLGFNALGNPTTYPTTATGGAASGVTFVASGSGTVGRTVEAKLRDVLSLKDFGAVGDGTTDDTAAVQAAVNAAGAAGRVLFVPPGYYRLTSTITIAAHVIIEGASGTEAASTQFTYAGSNDMFKVTAGAGAATAFSGLWLSHSGSGGYLINLDKAEACSIRHCALVASAGTGALIYFRGSSVTIENNAITNNRTNQFSIICDRKDGAININSVIRENYFGGSGSGILVYSSDASPRVEGIQISENQFITTGNQPHVEIRSVLSARIFGNMFDQGNTSCILLSPNDATYAVEDVIIQGNYISTSMNMTGVSGGIAIYGYPSGVGAISDVIINSNTIIYSGYGITFSSNAKNINVSDNVFAFIDQTALSIDQSKYVAISGNVIHGGSYELALTDGAAGGPFSVIGNYVNSSSSIVYTATDPKKFSFVGNTGKKLSGWCSASTTTISSGTQKYLSIPHGLAGTPSLDKIALSVRATSGGFLNVAVQVVSADATNVEVVIDYSLVTNGVLRVTAYAEL